MNGGVLSIADLDPRGKMIGTQAYRHNRSGQSPGRLLQGDDLSTVEAPGNTLEIVSAIKTEAVLYVIARKNHDIL